MGDLKVVEQLRKRFTGGSSSIQMAGKPTVTGILALTLRLYGSGGIARPLPLRFKDGHITVTVEPL